MRLIRVALAVAMLTLMAGVSTSFAKNYAPPGKAGTSQYAEDIPSGGGNEPTPAMGIANKSRAQINKIGSGKVGVSKLSKLGKTGAAAALFAQQTAPTTAVAAAHKPVVTGRPGARPRSELLPASGGSAVGGVENLITGSDAGGIGIFLPLFLIVCLVGAAALAVARIRTGRSEPQP